VRRPSSRPAHGAQPVGAEQARRDPALRAAFERVERTGRRGLTPLAELLHEYARATGLDRRRSGARRVFAAFDEAAGALARRLRPVRFLRGCLTIEVESAALMAELGAFRAQELRALANELLPRPEIRSLVFRPKA